MEVVDGPSDPIPERPVTRPTKSAKRYPYLDLLRLFLALEVAYSVHWAYKGYSHYFTIWIDPVPCFVCLSGMLIPQSFSSSERRYGNRGWQHFAWKRFLRVFPPFVACLLLILILQGPLDVWHSLIMY